MPLENYSINGSKKAVVYTLNNAEDCQPAEAAIEKLRTFFANLNFEIHPHKKYLTLKKTITFFQFIEKRNYRDIDYLIVIIVAHGCIQNGIGQVSTIVRHLFSPCLFLAAYFFQLLMQVDINWNIGKLNQCSVRFFSK
jgi:hypothetical protein